MTDSKMPRSQTPRNASVKFRRRTLLGAGAAALTFPSIWIPKPAFAQDSGARGAVKHLIYIRLNGGFRFTAAFNGDVGDQFNPFGVARGLPQGTEWGPSRLLESAPWLDATTRQLGMKSVTDISNEMALLATVDHEPFSGSADGNHGTGLERYLTGTVGGENSLFTMLNYGIRDQITAAAEQGIIKLPPFVLGSSGMSKGFGPYAAYRPPLVQGDSFDDFAFAGQSELPAWATRMITDSDQNYKSRLMIPAQSNVDAYVGTRESVEEFSEIFASDTLKIGNDSDVAIDGITNRELATMFGDDGAARRVRLGLRLFHHGCPAVYLDEGGYDMHSDEDMRLPDAMTSLNRLLSATNAALKRMNHDEEGYNYWDHTLIVLGSEFGRTTRGGRFNSAGGSDHGGDFATRWLSMPMMGGLVTSAGIGGRRFGVTRRSDLQDDGLRFSYRALWRTLMDTLGADHSEFFTADPPIEGLFAGTL
jgi:hypothetical protein